MSEEVACKSSVRRNSAKFTGKHLCQSLFFNEVAATFLAQLFPCEFCEFFKNTFDEENLWIASFQYVLLFSMLQIVRAVITPQSLMGMVQKQPPEVFCKKRCS